VQQFCPSRFSLFSIASVSPTRLSPAGSVAQNGDRWLPPVKLQFQCSTITKGFDPVAYFTKYPGWLISMPRDLLCALTANKGHLCFATARRGRCLGRTNRLVKTCELTRRAFVWCQGAQQVPRLPPDFLSSLVASINSMRLSLKKAAYVAVDESSVVGNPEYARDDKGEGGDFYGELSDRMDREQPQKTNLRSVPKGRLRIAQDVVLGGVNHRDQSRRDD
jgi:hypothetical protein